MPGNTGRAGELVLQLRGWGPDRKVSLGRIPIQDEMRLAAELEDGTEKSAVTPEPLAPARKLLGEMLLEMNDRANVYIYFRPRYLFASTSSGRCVSAKLQSATSLS